MAMVFCFRFLLIILGAGEFRAEVMDSSLHAANVVAATEIRCYFPPHESKNKTGQIETEKAS
jgi:hypothetical protein